MPVMEPLFYKIAGWGTIALFKRDSGTDIFMWKSRNF